MTYANFYRHPHHAAVRRAWAALVADPEARALLHRTRTLSASLLPPGAWEDQVRGDIDIRSWKEHREHQWHGGYRHAR